MFVPQNKQAMKMAAVRALATLAKEYVPEQVNIAYGATKLIFDDYIIPSQFDPRLISVVAPAVAAMESGVTLNLIWIRINMKKSF
jgi:malate dehydrogenase (oxaloacetate-decarboxylating)(NADP+)